MPLHCTTYHFPADLKLCAVVAMCTFRWGEWTRLLPICLSRRLWPSFGLAQQYALHDLSACAWHVTDQDSTTKHHSCQLMVQLVCRSRTFKIGSHRFLASRDQFDLIADLALSTFKDISPKHAGLLVIHHHNDQIPAVTGLGWAPGLQL